MRAPQPSGTNRPSSSLIFLRLLTRTGRCEPRCAALRARGSPPGGRNAAHRSAALAAGARPVPFRTRKLSRPAPMVLRGKPVGEQGAADRWTAFHRGEGPGGAIPRGPFPFRSRESSGPVPKLSWGIFGSANLWPPYVEQSSFRYVRAVLILIGNLLLFGVAGCGNDRCAPGSISSSHPYGRARIPSPAIRP